MKDLGNRLWGLSFGAYILSFFNPFGSWVLNLLLIIPFIYFFIFGIKHFENKR